MCPCHHVVTGGIPGVYIHSLLATGNDYDKMEATASNRSINRHTWDYDELELQLSKCTSQNAVALQQIKSLIKARIKQPAFHPNATQYTLHTGDSIFSFWQQSRKRDQSIFYPDITTEVQHTPSAISTWWRPTAGWLLSGRQFDDLRLTLEMQPYECLWIASQLPAGEN